ncbi:MAG: hypothetical protein NC177_03805 [Ruminococcus flavefaciens]|nr:hypothetical protein [Ruminococcus flavefaciens]
MLPPCSNRFNGNNDNNGCVPVFGAGFITAETVKIIGGGLVIICILGIAGAVLSAILGSYLKK